MQQVFQYSCYEELFFYIFSTRVVSGFVGKHIFFKSSLFFFSIKTLAIQVIAGEIIYHLSFFPPSGSNLKQLVMMKNFFCRKSIIITTD